MTSNLDSTDSIFGEVILYCDNQGFDKLIRLEC